MLYIRCIILQKRQQFEAWNPVTLLNNIFFIATDWGNWFEGNWQQNVMFCRSKCFIGLQNHFSSTISRHSKFIMGLNLADKKVQCSELIQERINCLFSILTVWQVMNVKNVESKFLIDILVSNNVFCYRNFGMRTSAANYNNVLSNKCQEFHAYL